MRTINMIGKVSGLCDSRARTSRELEGDTIAESQIVYPDLVFTLQKDSSKYCPPRARIEGDVFGKDRLVVVANNAFLRAARDAGLNEMMFDLEYNGRAFPAEQLMEEHELKLPKNPNCQGWINRFYFFRDAPLAVPSILGDIADCVKVYAETGSKEYLGHNCQRYALRVCGDEQKSVEREQMLIDRLVRFNSRLRSIDGIRRDSGLFKQFF